MCLCCFNTGDASCGFKDEDFSRPVWDDPDEMIQGGDVTGNLDTENSRVTTQLTFALSGSFRINARVSVSDGSNNWAGMEIVDAGDYNTSLVIESTGVGATDVVVRDRGTVPKSGNGEYLLTIEYVIGSLASPVINYYVDGQLVDSEIANRKSETGTLRLMAFTTARVMWVEIDCPPISGVDCIVCPEGQTLVLNAVAFPGAVDVLKFPPEHLYGAAYTKISVSDYEIDQEISWPIVGPHRLDFGGGGFGDAGGNCLLSRRIKYYDASWDGYGFVGEGRYRYHLIAHVDVIMSLSASSYTFRDLFTSRFLTISGSAYYLGARIEYQFYNYDEVPVGTGTLNDRIQVSCYALGFESLDCTALSGSVLPHVQTWSAKIETLNQLEYGEDYVCFDPGPSATALFIP